MNLETWKENNFIGRDFNGIISYLEMVSAGHPDPLSAYLPYISDYKMNLLEFVLRKFLTCGQYQNDVRYVKLWIIYANSTEKPDEVYLYLLQREIGKKCGVIYVALAESYEISQRYELAELAYLRGVISKALPFDKLSMSYTKFLERKQGKLSENQEISLEEHRALKHLRVYASNCCITPSISPQSSPISSQSHSEIRFSACKTTPDLEKIYQSPNPASLNPRTPSLINGRRPLGQL